MKEQDVINKIGQVRGVDNVSCIAIVWIDDKGEVRSVSRGPIKYVADALQMAADRQKQKEN